jgi:hypothetical protein
LTGIFTNETTFIACGFDKVPYVFKQNNKGKWSFQNVLDDGVNQVKQAQIAAGSFEGNKSIFQ